MGGGRIGDLVVSNQVDPNFAEGFWSTGAAGVAALPAVLAGGHMIPMYSEFVTWRQQQADVFMISTSASGAYNDVVGDHETNEYFRPQED